MAVVYKLLRFYLSFIAIFFLGRVALFILYFQDIQDTDQSYWLSFIYGLRMDTISANILLVIPLVLLTLTPKLFRAFVNIFLKYYFVFVMAFLIYIEIATFPFIAQYDVRPNYLFVEYLEYPQEVFSMIVADYKLQLVMAFAMIGGFIYLYLKNFKENLDQVYRIHFFKRALLFVPLLLILFIGVRSSFGHRGANVSDAMYSSNRMLNEITKNSIHSIGYAIYVNAKHEGKSISKQYGEMDLDEAISRVEKLLNIQSENKKLPLNRFEKTHFETQKPKNIVLFIQESMGYQFVEAVGGEKGITPYLNQLSKEGILFKEFYSNGTRSIRGLAGLVAGNFSVPGKGVLKRNKSQKDFFTIAKLLKPHGYHTSFIYGGESRFDNMKSWFSGNGFDEIIDQPKFENPQFVGTWGVCDEEVVIRANEEYKKLYAEDKKFASVIFSTSNHAPFDFPDGKIELVKGVEKKSVKNAIKYADYAIGKFIELAKKEEYYKDTIFVIAADHNVRVYGKNMIPVEMFQVPGLILGGGVEAQEYRDLATQPDVLATALDLIGIDATYPIMGHSIFSEKKKALSFMQFNDFYALRIENKVALLRPGKDPITFEYKDKVLHKIESDKELEQNTLAMIITLDHMYNQKLYR